MNKPWDNPYVIFSMQNGIVKAVYRKTASPITLEKAMLIKECRMAFQQGQILPLLVTTEGWIEMDQPARSYLAGPDGVEGVKAAALLERNTAVKLVIGFFLAFMPKSIPVKTFRREKAALEWLDFYK
ncbi:DUF7793 family protein [Dinghuibacter silviterrae]|uniref:DUF7793 domain-containing protein n=1 Tax=Dinghuibacter silviterrae TaxID=1539049 RepID=A0A4R8DH92_9BACT|nr:hypothetical protein [Dinghuibacter silviterrae]TDW97081.1 hypothetical protein EDB95_4921 [Dinghuibacter silviterrae]